MSGFERGDVVLHHAAQAHHFERMRAQGFLDADCEGDEEENAGQENDDDHASGGAGEELKMKMSLAEKPARDFGQSMTCAFSFVVNGIDLRDARRAIIIITRKQVLLPTRALQTRSPPVLKQPQYRTRTRNNPSAGAADPSLEVPCEQHKRRPNLAAEITLARRATHDGSHHQAHHLVKKTIAIELDGNAGPVRRNS